MSTQQQIMNLIPLVPESKLDGVLSYIQFAIKDSGGEGVSEPDPYFSGENMRHITRSLADFKAGRCHFHELIEAGDE